MRCKVGEFVAVPRARQRNSQDDVSAVESDRPLTGIRAGKEAVGLEGKKGEGCDRGICGRKDQVRKARWFR